MTKKTRSITGSTLTQLAQVSVKPKPKGRPKASNKSSSKKASTKTKSKPKPKGRPKMTQADVRLKGMVDKANRRIDRLRHEGIKNSSNAYKYLSALEDMGDFTITRSKAGNIKFTTSISKLTYNQKKHLEKEVSNFLKAKTSTVKGYKERYEQTRKTLNEKYKINISQEEFNEMWSNALYITMVSVYGSDISNAYYKEVSEINLSDAEKISIMESGGNILEDIKVMRQKASEPDKFESVDSIKSKVDTIDDVIDVISMIIK